MNISFNETFIQLLNKYGLSNDFSFEIDIPEEVQKILNDEIVISDLGVTLSSFNTLRISKEIWETKSIIEDSENHFHVDWYIKDHDVQKIFMLGIKTTILLAQKFLKENIHGIKFWYSFQTPELGYQFAKSNNLDVDEDHLVSDRISFFTVRDNEKVITDELANQSFWAILIIEI